MHNQCQAAKPAPSRTTRTSWPGSAAHLCPSWVPAEEPASLGRGGLQGKEHRRRREGQAVAGSQPLSEAYSSYPPFSSPLLVLQTVSINKAINTQEVAVKEKHARNILLDVGEGWPRGGQVMGTEVRRSSCMAIGGNPFLARCLQAGAASGGSCRLSKSTGLEHTDIRVGRTHKAMEPSPFSLP